MAPHTSRLRALDGDWCRPFFRPPFGSGKTTDLTGSVKNRASRRTAVVINEFEEIWGIVGIGKTGNYFSTTRQHHIESKPPMAVMQLSVCPLPDQVNRNGHRHWRSARRHCYSSSACLRRACRSAKAICHPSRRMRRRQPKPRTRLAVLPASANEDAPINDKSGFPRLRVDPGAPLHPSLTVSRA